MLNENQNNQGSWKKKLEDLEFLSERPFNKDSAWEKLHDRLFAKNRRTKKVAIWAAAACLVLLFAVVRMFTHDKEIPVATTGKQIKKADIVAAPPNEMIMDSMQEPVANKQPRSQHIKNKIPQTVTVYYPSVDTITKQNLAMQVDVPEKNHFEMTSMDTAALTATLPKKKTLRVVHINELGESAPAPVKFVPKNTSDELSGFTVSRNASDNIFKIKLSPSN